MMDRFTGTSRVERYDNLTDSWKLVGAYYEMSDAKTVVDIERANDPETYVRIVRTLDY